MSSDRERSPVLEEGKGLVIAGIDLSLKKRTSLCTYSWGKTAFSLERVQSADEIVPNLISEARKGRSIIIVIDAPLSFDPEEKFRDLDRLAASLGCRLLPVSFRGMRELASAGKRLSESLKKELKDAVIVETHPHCSALLMGFSSTEEMVQEVLGISLRGDDADAAACCIVGIMIALGEVVEIADEQSSDIFVIPEVKR